MKTRLFLTAILLGIVPPSRSSAARPPSGDYQYTFKDSAEALERYSKDTEPEMKILTVQTIGELGGSDAVKILEKLFKKEKDPTVRRAILLQLASLLPDERESVDFFCHIAINDRDHEIRLLALNQASLYSRTEWAARELLETSRTIYKKDDYKDIRILAAIILGELGEKGRKLSLYILEGLENPAVEVRRRAAGALKDFSAPETLDLIQRGAKDADSEVRANLCKSLGQAREKDTAFILKDLIEDSDSSVRKEALIALSAFRPEDAGLDLFLNALSDRDPAVRLEAVGALEKYDNPRAIPALEKAAAEDWDSSVRQLARKALANLKSDTPP